MMMLSIQQLLILPELQVHRTNMTGSFLADGLPRQAQPTQLVLLNICVGVELVIFKLTEVV